MRIDRKPEGLQRKYSKCTRIGGREVEMRSKSKYTYFQELLQIFRLLTQRFDKEVMSH